jgi:CRP-like cAMP-binding protein
VDAGGIVGEMALVDKAPRSANVVAKTDCVLVPIDEAAFMRHVHSTPFFALQVLRITVKRLRQQMEV